MTHIRPIDYLAHVLENAPLPCACEDCRKQAALWEQERGKPGGKAGSLPPGFWAGQEEAVRSRMERPHGRALSWALAAGAATLVVTAGVLYNARPTREARWTEVQARYETALNTLDQPALGDLEACSLMFAETTDTTDTTDTEEESL